ncbi:MAG: FAD-dependent oxidoreductase [Thermodesulfobacteriota bacterium]|nr:FAD-dependent oxidoreductase [Thermodesulfobacteriota bacterium]
MHEGCKVVIIGGGIIGATAAYYLQQKGWSVTIVDKDRFGYGASHGNCGLIVPDHILPLNSADNLIKGIGWIFKKDAPLFIKPRLDPGLAKWLLKFALHCKQKDILISAQGRAAMTQGAIELYQALITEEELDCDWAMKGALHIFRSKREFEKYGSGEALKKEFGVGETPLDKKLLLKQEPAVGDHVAGAWFSKHTAHLCPDGLMKELKRVLTQKGVEIIEQTEVTGFIKENNQAVAAVAGRGHFSGDQFVVATGAWAPRLNNALGCKLPIQPGKGYSVNMRRPTNSPTIPCFFQETGVVLTPWQNHIRLGGTMEFAGYDASLNQVRLDALVDAAERYLPEVKFSGIQDEWYGWRPMTCDGLPIIDRSPLMENVMIAAGHNMMGLTMAPRTGKLVCEILSGDSPHVDPYPYRASRF